MKRNSLSIIVPIYNAETYLNRCITSLLEAESEDEIILVNDGSTDGSLGVCEKYSNSCSNIKILNQINSGVSCARNSGIHFASSEWIMFVDADDVLVSGWRNVVSRVLQEVSEDCDAIIFAQDIQDGTYMSSECAKAAFGFEKSLGESLGFPFSKLYRKRLIEDYNLFFSTDLINGEDMIFNANVFALSKEIHGVRHSIYQYYKNLKSATNRFNPNIIKTEHAFHAEMRKIITSYFSDDSVWNKFYEVSLLTGLYAVMYRIALSAKSDYSMLELLIQEDEYKLALEQLVSNRNYLPREKYIVLTMLKTGNIQKAIWFTKVIYACKKVYYRLHRSEIVEEI